MMDTISSNEVNYNVVEQVEIVQMNELQEEASLGLENVDEDSWKSNQS